MTTATSTGINNNIIIIVIYAATTIHSRRHHNHDLRGRMLIVSFYSS